MKRCAWGLLCLAVVVSVARPWGLAVAHAEAARLPLELDWRAPAECPAEPAVRAELERIAHARPGHVLERLVARAEVKHKAASDKPYSLRLETEHEGQHGQRDLEAQDCRELVRMLTLVLALTFGAGVDIAEPEPAPEVAPPPPEPAPPAVPMPATRDDLPPAPALLPLRVAMWAAGGAQLGLFPRVAGSLALGVSLRFGAASLGLDLHALRAPAESLQGDARAHFDALGGGLRGCLHTALASLDGALCAGGRAAALRGRSTVQGRDDAATAPWGAVTAALELSWPREHWLRVGAEAALALSINRPRFVIAGLEEVHRVPTAMPSGALLLIFEP